MFLLLVLFFLFSVTESGGQSDPGQGFGGHFEINMPESEGERPNPIPRVSFSVSKDNFDHESIVYQPSLCPLLKIEINPPRTLVTVY